jgi:hypothetical protein
MSEAIKEEPYSKGYCASQMTFYAVTWAEIRQTARKHGYALALHGSLSRDLDVIAVPWVENPSDEETLVKAICDTAGGFMPPHKHNPEIKFHGRKAWVIHFGGASAEVLSEHLPRYIDLSVMPVTPKL